MLLAERNRLLVDASGDEADQVRDRAARDLAIESLERQFGLLRLIREAQERLKSGEYGVCVECEEAISTRRLEAVPWAALCVRCQELAEDSGRSDARATEVAA